MPIAPSGDEEIFRLLLGELADSLSIPKTPPKRRHLATAMAGLVRV